MFKDQFLIGLAWGSILPLIGFSSLYGINEIIVNKAVISSGFIGFKLSTIALFAICFNLIPTFFANRWRMDNYIRGIMIPTMIGAFTWFFYFRSAMLFD